MEIRANVLTCECITKDGKKEYLIETEEFDGDRLCMNFQVENDGTEDSEEYVEVRRVFYI